MQGLNYDSNWKLNSFQNYYQYDVTFGLTRQNQGKATWHLELMTSHVSKSPKTLFVYLGLHMGKTQCDTATLKVVEIWRSLL